MLLSLYAGSTESDHAEAVDAFLAGASSPYLLPSVVFVSERAGKGLSGFLELSVRNYAEGCVGATPYVESWYVDPDVRGTGVGRLLIEAAECWSLAHGYKELASDADIGNTLSHDVHKALGFEEEERVVHFRKTINAAP